MAVPSVKQAAKRLRQWGTEVDRFPGAGMDKVQLRRMQRKAARKLRQLCTVEEIAAHRAAQRAQVHADLVGAARFQAQPDQRSPAATPQHRVVRARRPALRGYLPAHRGAHRLGDRVSVSCSTR